MSDIFISYSRKDIAFARLLQEALRNSQFDAWIDWERIPVGEKWWQEITEAIQNANVFVFIVSQHSIGSKVCKDEIELALKNNKRIIPILVDNLKPEDLREFVPELPQFNWIVFEREHIFYLEENPDAKGEKPEDRQMAFPRLPQFKEALEKLSAAIHTDWAWVKYHTRLQVDALRWENNQRDASYLLHGAELEEAERQLMYASGKEPQPTALQVEYVTASRQEETRRQQEQLRLEQKARRRQQAVIWTVAIGLVVAVTLGLSAWNQRNQYLSEARLRATAQAEAVAEANARATQEAIAIEQKNQAEIRGKMALSHGLAAQSINLLETNYDLSLLLSVEAMNSWDLYQARNSLLSALMTHPRLISILRLPEAPTDLAFSPDGKTLASSYCAQRDADRNCTRFEVQLFDMSTRQPLGEPISGIRAPIAFLPDGQALLGLDHERQLVRLDLGTRHTEKMLAPSFTYGLRDLVISPDGSLAAAVGCTGPIAGSTNCMGSDCNQLIVWRLSDGKPAFQTTILTYSLFETGFMAFTPNGKTLAWGGCADESTCQCTAGSIYTWEIPSGEVTRHIVQNASAVISLAYSPDGTSLAAGDTNGAISTIDNTTWETRSSPIVTTYEVSHLFYLQNGWLASTGVREPIELWGWNAAKRMTEPIDRLSITSAFLHKAIAFDPYGSTLAVAGCDQYDNTGFLCKQGIVLFLDMSEQPSLGSIFWKKPEDASRGFLSPDGKYLAYTTCTKSEKLSESNPNTRCIGGIVAIVDVATGQQVGTSLEGLPADADAIVFDQDSTRLVTSSCNRYEEQSMNCAESRIDWWDLETGQRIGKPIVYPDRVISMAVAPGGKVVVFDGLENTIGLWNLETGEPVGNPLDGFKWAPSFAFSPDGKTMTAAGCVRSRILKCEQSEVRFWDTVTWQKRDEVIVFTPEGPNDDVDISDLTFSPSGSLLAIALDNGTVKLWDVNSHQFLSFSITEEDPIQTIAFDRQGSVLAVYGYLASDDTGRGSFRLWDLEAMLPLGGIFTDISDGGRIVFNLENTRLISNSGVMWDMLPAVWQKRACQMANRNLTQEEWKLYVGNYPYHKTCPNLP